MGEWMTDTDDLLDDVRQILHRMERNQRRQTKLLRGILQELQNHPQANQAITAVLTLGGNNMALTVDNNGNAVLGFKDDKGDAVGPPPGDGSGLVVTFESDNTAVATVGASTTGTDAEGNTTYTAPISSVSEGSFNLSATVANVSGATLTAADGVTPFTQPEAINVPVAGGQAVSADLSVE